MDWELDFYEESSFPTGEHNDELCLTQMADRDNQELLPDLQMELENTVEQTPVVETGSDLTDNIMVEGSSMDIMEPCRLHSARERQIKHDAQIEKKNIKPIQPQLSTKLGKL